MHSLIKASSLFGIDRLITELGGNPHSILQQFNMLSAFHNQHSQFMSYCDYANLLQYCATTLNCPSFGMQLASRQNFDILGQVAIAAKSGTKLGDALEWVVKYLHLHSPALTLTTHTLGGNENVFLSFEIAIGPLPTQSQLMELTIALAASIIKKLSQAQCKPIKVYLPQKISTNTHFYNTFFGCDVIEHRNSAGILIAKKDLQIALNHSQKTNVEAAIRFLAQQNQHQQTLPVQVSALIRPMLPIYQSSNNTIAAALNMHPRKLHRELKKFNTSFVKLKDAARYALCEQYLIQNQFTVTQISELLGYQEQATLCASIKRWFGCSARAFRAKHC